MARRPASSFPGKTGTGRGGGAREQGGVATPPGMGADSTFPEPVAPPVVESFSDSRFFHRTLLVAGVTVLTGVLLTLVWYAGDVFLLMFGGVLFAVLLRAPTNWLTAHTRLPDGAAFAISATVVLGGLAGLFYVFAVPLAGQIASLIDTLPEAFTRLRMQIRDYAWARALHPLILELSRVRVDALTLGRATWILSSTAATVGAILVVIFIGIYLAAQPRLYQRGFMHLLPRRRRPRAYEVMDEIGMALRKWLVARIATMALVGFAAGIGLWWLGVPYAITLGVLTGLLEFVPYVGPIMAAAAPLLIAFNLDPILAFYVLLLYAGIQGMEGYLITPLVEQRTVALPPALVIFSTILLAAMAGPVGVVLASPLTASVMVAVRLLYVEDVVEQPMAV